MVKSRHRALAGSAVIGYPRGQRCGMGGGSPQDGRRGVERMAGRRIAPSPPGRGDAGMLAPVTSL